jgi:hypothetical protein
MAKQSMDERFGGITVVGVIVFAIILAVALAMKYAGVGQ